jgi:hypothetical protein
MNRFYLLNPTAPREYVPLRELRTTIQQILECKLMVLFLLGRQADSQSTSPLRTDISLEPSLIPSISIVLLYPDFNLQLQHSPLLHLAVTPPLHL